ncbi:hypothetical protein BURPS1710b_2362 [Burkholderia pseudomallei 1710b]|uniref:Uncharacterized protein n=1 Tax=Burkholderia pseudomallei (strain 1710b) TaxID=320372 RepID=Q3JRP6_BURP1|nr:hypothetical protein BURPS1710b_2362 [Burkholderia pseudomallei 1710b]
MGTGRERNGRPRAHRRRRTRPRRFRRAVRAGAHTRLSRAAGRPKRRSVRRAGRAPAGLRGIRRDRRRSAAARAGRAAPAIRQRARHAAARRARPAPRVAVAGERRRAVDAPLRARSHAARAVRAAARRRHASRILFGAAAARTSRRAAAPASRGGRACARERAAGNAGKPVRAVGARGRRHRLRRLQQRVPQRRVPALSRAVSGCAALRRRLARAPSGKDAADDSGRLRHRAMERGADDVRLRVRHRYARSPPIALRNRRDGACVRSSADRARIERRIAARRASGPKGIEQRERLERCKSTPGKPWLASDERRFETDGTRDAHSMRRSAHAAHRIASSVERGEILGPVRRGLLHERVLHERDLLGVLGGRQAAAHLLEPAIQQVGVHDVGLAVIANLFDSPFPERRPHLAAVHPELARKAAQLRERIERRARARLVEREQIHQVQMPRVIARQIIVPLEVAIVLAHVPVARRRNAVHERAVMQHRQIEAAAVPRHELRRVLLDHAVERLDQRRLRVVRRAERAHAKAVVVAKHARDRRDPLQMVREEIAARLLPARGERVLGHFGVGEVGGQIFETADAVDIGNRLDVKNQNRCH